MAEKINDKEKPAQGATEDAPIPAPLPTPSPTFYSEMAAALVAAVDRLTESVPEFAAPVVPTLVVERKRRVPSEFVARAVGALLVSAELQTVKALNPAQIIDDKQFVDAFEPLAAHVSTALNGLRRVIVARKARLTASAQQIYAFSKALAREREAAPIAEHVENMKRTLRPVAGRKKDAEAAKKEETTTSKTSGTQQ
ncbi:MAG TPA: hypothetical protein VGF28_24125 [Thermoanaerobaculia bacterium]|jgi:hypothetical protein